MTDAEPMLAGIELGGTKVQVLRARGTTVCDRETIATTTPRATLSRVVAVLERWHAQAPIAAIGNGSFATTRPGRRPPGFGVMLPTPLPDRKAIMHGQRRAVRVDLGGRRFTKKHSQSS